MPWVGTMKDYSDDGHCGRNPHIPHIGIALGVQPGWDRSGSMHLRVGTPTFSNIVCHLQ